MRRTLSRIYVEPCRVCRLFTSVAERKPVFRAGGMTTDGPRAKALKEQETQDRNSGKRPSFHTRDFPKCLVDYRSKDGKAALMRALNNGTAEQYLNLTAAYVMQSEPAYCALTTLAVALNALHLDPNKIWKGGWRWFTEANLHFCPRKGSCQTIGLEEGRGLNIFDLRCIARTNGASLKIHIADINEGFTDDFFRNEVIALCSEEIPNTVMITNFDRQSLAQTGGGHFSPIAAYDAESDSVLVLDVARFKYPPFWVTIEKLCQAMKTVEPVSGRPRGFALVRPGNGHCCIDDKTHDTCNATCNTPHP